MQQSLLNFFKKSPDSNKSVAPKAATTVLPKKDTTKASSIERKPQFSKSTLSVNKETQPSGKKSNEKVSDFLDEDKYGFSRNKNVKKNPEAVNQSKDHDEDFDSESFEMSTKKNDIDNDLFYENQKLFDDMELEENSNEANHTKSLGRLRVPSESHWVPKRRGRVLTKESQPEEQDVWVNLESKENKVFCYGDFFDATPHWARKENAKDASGRRPGDPDYDPETLFVPPEALKDMTPAIKQYWQIKSKNYDKVMLFKVGKFFEIYYDDALICHEEIGLRWRGGRMETNFPEQSLEKFAYRLVSKGHKVCIVEQLETPRQMEARYKAEKLGYKNKIIKREPIQILSRGTYLDYKEPTYESRILLSLRQRGNLISVSFLDIGSNLISLGYFHDDENFTLFKMLVSQVRPVEVIYEPIDVDTTLLKIIKNNPNSPTFSSLSKPQDWNTIQGYHTLEKFCGSKEDWPKALKHIMGLDTPIKDSIIKSLSGMMNYLTKLLILDNVFSTARFTIYDIENFQASKMVLDSQALHHLEVLEVGYMSGTATEKGSLLDYIDHTSSKFGKRLLKKWISAPLMNVKAINDRLDAIEDLNNAYEQRQRIQKELRPLPDLERMCGRIYNMSAKANENVFLYDDVSTVRLREFKNLLESLRKGRNLISSFQSIEIKSALLKQLTTLEDYEYFLQENSDNVPDILPILKIIGDYVAWAGPNHDIPQPKIGIQDEYDIAKGAIESIQTEFEEYLKEVRKQYRGNREIIYAHTKHRYEVEFPAELVAHKRPDGFEFSSRKKGKERFITSKIKALVIKLEEAEEDLKRSLNLFLWSLFKKFHSYYRVWDRFIDALGQIDCLCSLSLTSFISDGVMCRPEIHSMTSAPFLEVRDMRHPCICMTKANFISNDIILGDPTVEEHSKYVILLTGPNMGGKSTILRQASIAVILGQIGCYVPASSCKFSVVDRIFTRIGASDNLMEGKSTFFIEMEETANVLKYGTANSLVIMDELGRGTSTFDGVSIAYSVLNYLISTLKCRTFFSTHYHVLLEEFRDSKEIAFFHMASKVDTFEEKVLFLYKLVEGGCINSFGINIARISGLPKEVIAQAKLRSKEFEESLNLRECVKLSKAVEKILGTLQSVKETQEDEDQQDYFNVIDGIVTELKNSP